MKDGNGKRIEINLGPATLWIDPSRLEEFMRTVRDMPAEADARSYLSNERVSLRGGFGTFDNREIVVNWSDPIKLGPLEFAVLFILASHALTMGGMTPLYAIPGLRFLSAKRIIGEIDILREKGGTDVMLPETLIYSDIYRVVNKLRIKLQSHRLIESGSRGSGYRLSTPVGLIDITGVNL